MFGSVAAVYEKVPHLDARRLPTRRHIRLVLYEDTARLGVSDKGPTIAVRCTAI
jgi:hypothetical protein